MSSLNEATLIGHLGRDPEIRSTQTGDRVASLSLATSEQWTDKQSGERRERTEWHRIVVFNQRLVDVVERYVHKGDRILVRGKLQTRKWQTQDGQDRYTTEIVLGPFDAKLVMLSGRRAGGDDVPPGDAPSDGGAAGATGQQRPPAHHPDLDDDIPF